LTSSGSGFRCRSDVFGRDGRPDQRGGHRRIT
jgi:hypothetical protein